MIYVELFLVFVQIGALSFGGGYAAMPVIQRLVVEEKGWLTLSQFADLQTISEMTPGPNMLNAATFTGLRIAGIQGALICTFGCILPSLLIVLLLAYVYKKYKELDFVKEVLKKLRPAVVAMIAKAAVVLVMMAVFTSSGSIKWIELCLFGICLCVLQKTNVSPIVVIVVTAVVGPLLYLISSWL